MSLLVTAIRKEIRANWPSHYANFILLCNVLLNLCAIKKKHIKIIYAVGERTGRCHRATPIQVESWKSYKWA